MERAREISYSCRAFLHGHSVGNGSIAPADVRLTSPMPPAPIKDVFGFGLASGGTVRYQSVPIQQKPDRYVSVDQAVNQGAERLRVVVAICTYHRNEALEKLLSELVRTARSNADAVDLGVVVSDDSAEQLARELVMSFDSRFKLGATYRHSGARNISKARNLAIETAAAIADWVAMTDDDCEPGESWLAELLRIQAETDAQVVTGPLVRRAPPGSPKWIVEQPFLALCQFTARDGEELGQAFTNNSMISARVLIDNPDLRFDTDFGRIGGEDMVFYRQVARAGHKICFARNALVFENEGVERLTLTYQLRRFFWYGNTSVLTSIEQGFSRNRMAVHGFATVMRALAYPIGRAIKGNQPHLLYSLARIFEGFGKLAGVAGIRVPHR